LAFTSFFRFKNLIMLSPSWIRFPLLLVTIALFCSFAYAQRAVLTVTTLADTDDGICDAHCSLREAIAAANAFDTVIFARELRGGSIELTSPLIISRYLTIDGPNKRRITLKGNNTFRILETRALVTLDGLIIRDGNEPNGNGGGILSAATLQLINCAVLNNSARRGGGIYSTFGTMYLTNSTLANNTASAEDTAGGIDAVNTMLRINNSTISGNRNLAAVNGAGAIRVIISNPGGGSSIVNSTIAFNSTTATSTISAGGLVTFGGGQSGLTNTILAKNTGGKSDFFGSAVARNILIGIAYPGSGYVNGVNGNIVGTVDAPVDPQIDPLTDNGGGLPTHALRPRSLAIDAGNNELAFGAHGGVQTVDQRGFNRFVNFTVDIGAFEDNSMALPALATVKGIVRTTDGRGLFKARVSVRDTGGAERSVMTLPFGYYHINGLPPDLSYTIKCEDKRYAFLPQTLLVEEAIEYVDCRAQ
jgi:CSLREA domain-containing protein